MWGIPNWDVTKWLEKRVTRVVFCVIFSASRRASFSAT